MKEISLTQGQVAFVDDELFDFLNQWKWHAEWSKKSKIFYARRNAKEYSGKKIMLYMHRVVLNAPPGINVDHMNRNGLHNYKDNLRLATDFENNHNRGMNSENLSGFKGVSWDKVNKKWRAQIMVGYKPKNIGRYDDILCAAEAWNNASLKYHGEFAYQNPLPY